MKRGIAPIVAVVLLIAIAVVAAVGLYFWAGGLVTKQSTPATPIAITATPLDPANGKIAVANLGDSALTISRLNTADGTYCDFGETVTIQPGNQAVCTMPPKRGKTILYGSNVSQAVVILPIGDIAETTFQANGFSSGSWSADLPSGTFGTNTESGSIKLIGNTPTFTGEWPMFHLNLNHTGYTTTGGGPYVNNLLASYTTSGAVESSPAVANGYVYVGSNDGKVYQLNASNIAQEIGQYTTGGLVISSPAVANGYVYVGSNDGKVYQLNASNISQVITSYSIGTAVYRTSPALVGSVVYIGSSNNKLYALGGHPSPGSYYSEVKDSGNNFANWTSFTWVNTTPANTAITMYANVTNTTSSGSWTAVSKGDSPGVGRYIQFKAVLESTDGINTPVISSVSADYEPLMGNITYTVNSDTALSWVALNKTCSGVTTTPYTESTSGTFYSKTVSVPADCSYLVWGPGLSNSTTYP